MMAVFFDNEVEFDILAKHSNVKFHIPTEQERQNMLDDIMGWKRGWRDEPINHQTTKERLAYLYNPDDCMTEEEFRLCREKYNDLVTKIYKQKTGGI